MKKLIFLIALPLFFLSTCEEHEKMATANFTLTIEVLSTSDSPIAPGIYAVHSGYNPIFTPDSMDKLDGLEDIAEDGLPSQTATSIQAVSNVITSGVFDTPDGDTSAGPAARGNSYSFAFSAVEENRLSFATMYVQSNDLFYSPGENGIALFVGGTAIAGDITSQIMLWDAGTEVNEEPGVGLNQAPRQSDPDTGTTESNPVMLISDVDDGFTYPSVADIIRVMITSE